jgi:glycosyltransferase involved in cell wall biosynthesis
MVAKLLVLMPCFNERETILSVIMDINTILSRIDIPSDILVIDDGSTDGSAQIAQGHAFVLRLVVNCGVAVALHAGYLFAVRHGYDACLHFDADGQHPADAIPRLLDAQQKTDCDIVLASRYLMSQGYQSSLTRRMTTRLIASIASLFHNISLTDPTSGLKLVTGKAMEDFVQSSALDYPEPITLSLLTSHRYSFTEVPVSMKPRLHGKSYLTPLIAVSFMVKVVIRLIFGRYRQ